MDNLIFMLTLLEMLCVNMYIFHICSEKKAKTFIIILVIGFFTALLLGVSRVLFADMDIFARGNFMAFGMIYLIPLSFLYRQPIKDSISIMCSAWIYSMLIYTISILIADLFPQQHYPVYLLTIQTVLYAFTILLFFKFVTQKFMYILKNADQKIKNILFWLGILWCLLIFLLYYTLIFDMPYLLEEISKILILCTSAANAFMTYQIFYFFCRENQNVTKVENALRLDALTGLKNRAAFLEDAQAIIDSQTPFTLFFLDLDDFKSVNDKHGHINGDQYLKQFSDSFSSGFSSYGTVYRISGDEFVFLYVNGKHDHTVYKKISNFNMHDCAGIPFKGFSIGSASFPKEAQTLNNLIITADKRMYSKKNIRN